MSSSATIKSNTTPRNGKTLAFLSSAVPESYSIYDELLIEPLKQRGWTVTAPRLNWHFWREIDWSLLFDVVVVRSTWDYQNHLPEFHEALTHIQRHHEKQDDRKPVILMNDVELIKWNSRKTYCIDLVMKAGAIINPSLFLHDRAFYSHLLPADDGANITAPAKTGIITRQEFDVLIQKSLDVFPEILGKPICGACSFGIVRITRQEFIDSTATSGGDAFVFTEDPAVIQLREGQLTDFGEGIPELKDLAKRGEGEAGKMRVEFKSKLDFFWCVVRAAQGDYILQPYIDTITTHGEFSLFFFNPNKISHAMRKIPMNGDFRVQEEYGAKHARLETDWNHNGGDDNETSAFDSAKHLDPAAVVAAKKLFAAFPSSSSFKTANPQDQETSHEHHNDDNNNNNHNNLQWLYARVDLIPIPKEIVRKCRESKWGFCCRDDVDIDAILPASSPYVWSTMECEVVEPSLYFNVCSRSCNVCYDQRASSETAARRCEPDVLLYRRSFFVLFSCRRLHFLRIELDDDRP